MTTTILRIHAPHPLDRAHRELLGPVMGVVAATVGFSALGAYLGRGISGGTGVLLFVDSFAIVFGLSTAVVKRSRIFAVGFLLALGLSFGLAVAPLVADYAEADPSVLWHASGATAASVAALGGYGYATGRQHSSWTRSLIWALIALITFGIVTTFFTMPGVHVIFAVASLGIFGAFTLVDFGRVTDAGEASAALIAANIFLGIFELVVSSFDPFDDSHHATPGRGQRR